MEASKIQIGLLEGKSNWSTCKHKVCILLRSIPDPMDVIEGRLTSPLLPTSEESQEDKTTNEKYLTNFTKVDSSVLLIPTINMTQGTLQKVMRFSSARDVWLELHRMCDGNIEDKTYDLCTQFLTCKRQCEDDIAYVKTET